MWGSNPSLLREKPWVLNSLLICRLSCWGRVNGETVFQPLLTTLIYFFLCPMYSCCSTILSVVFRGNPSVCSSRLSVAVGGGQLRIFLYHHLELEPDLSAFKCKCRSQDNDVLYSVKPEFLG